MLDYGNYFIRVTLFLIVTSIVDNCDEEYKEGYDS